MFTAVVLSPFFLMAEGDIVAAEDHVAASLYNKKAGEEDGGQHRTLRTPKIFIPGPYTPGEIPPPGQDLIVTADSNMWDDSRINVIFLQNILNYILATGPRAAATGLFMHSGNRTGLGFGTRNPLTFRTTVTAAGYTLTAPGDGQVLPSAIPRGIKVLWLWLPNVANFTTAQVNGIKLFAAEGGRVVLSGEDGFAGSNSNPILNTLLGQLGSGMSIGPDDILGQFSATNIAPAQLTTGVTRVDFSNAAFISIRAGVDASLIRYPYDSTKTLVGVTRINTTKLAK